MKNILDNIDKLLENRVRLGIMSILMVNDDMDFNSLKEMLDLTDGNLASHLSSLEKKNYITVSKQFVGRKTKTGYQATAKGRKAFQDHIGALEKIIKGQT